MKQAILKSLLSWVFFFLWIILCFLSIQAFNNWNNVSTVETTTPLTKDLWNTTMNTLTWNIQQLEDKVNGLWLKNGNNVYYNWWNVGIWTDTPTSKLDLNGSLWIKWNKWFLQINEPWNFWWKQLFISVNWWAWNWNDEIWIWPNGSTSTWNIQLVASDVRLTWRIHIWYEIVSTLINSSSQNYKRYYATCPSWKYVLWWSCTSWNWISENNTDIADISWNKAYWCYKTESSDYLIKAICANVR